MCLLCVQRTNVTESCMVSVHLSNSKCGLMDKEREQQIHIKHFCTPGIMLGLYIYFLPYLTVTWKQMLTFSLTVKGSKTQKS